MKPEDKGKVVKVKGVDELILDVDKYGGFTSIEKDKLTKKMEDIFSEESLAQSELEGNMPPGFRKMPLIAVIKSNIAGNDSMGWKKHQQALKDNGFDA